MKNQLLYFLFQAGKPEQNIGVNLFSQLLLFIVFGGTVVAVL
jgi:hypothetical protein